MRHISLALPLSTLVVYCVFSQGCPAQLTVTSVKGTSSNSTVTRTSDSREAARTRSGIPVDFQLGEVDGINLRNPIDKIKSALGPSAVKEETEELEGESTKVYVLSFTDHKVYRHWNAFSWRDPIFVRKV